MRPAGTPPLELRVCNMWKSRGQWPSSTNIVPDSLSSAYKLIRSCPPTWRPEFYRGIGGLGRYERASVSQAHQPKRLEGCASACLIRAGPSIRQMSKGSHAARPLPAGAAGSMGRRLAFFARPVRAQRQVCGQIPAVPAPKRRSSRTRRARRRCAGCEPHAPARASRRWSRAGRLP